MMEIKVPVLNKRARLRIQLSMMHDIICKKKSLEIKVLEYLLRNSTNGLYQVKQGYRNDIAKYISKNNKSVCNIIERLKAKGLLISYPGDSLGVYSFHPAILSLKDNHESIKFNFVNN